MPDRLFFPLAALVAAVFVVLAMEPFADRAPSGPVSGGGRNAEDITVRGPELHRFLTGESSGLDIIDPDESGGAETLARITRMTEEVYEDPRSGPHLMLAEDLEYAFEARPVEVTVEARGVGDFAASEFQINYLARSGDESGWKTFALTTDFAPYVLTYTTPPRGSTEGYDYIGVRPVAPDKRRTIEVRSVRIRAAGPKDFSAPDTSVMTP